MGKNRNSQGLGRPLRDIYVARTVEDPQRPFENFLKRVGKRLGHMASVKTITSTHVTFLESSGSIKQTFRNHQFTPDDVRQFSGALQSYLDKQRPRENTRVAIDDEQPLVWYPNNKLALNVVPIDELLEQREVIEQFLVSHFDSVPKLKSFEPHITLGHVDSRVVSREVRQDPRVLLPNIYIPTEVALNGLMVYLDNIGSDSSAALYGSFKNLPQLYF